MWLRDERVAISKILMIGIVLLVLIIAVAAYEVSNSPSSGGETIDMHIYEDNPVLQEDHFYADTIYVPLNQNVTLAIQNLDDEARVFTLSQFNVNVTMSSGATQRATFVPNKLGNFSFISPIAPPSAVSAGRKAPCLEGFLIVTQNATLLSTTTTGTGIAPNETQVIAASNGPVGGCSPTPLTIP